MLGFREIFYALFTLKQLVDPRWLPGIKTISGALDILPVCKTKVITCEQDRGTSTSSRIKKLASRIVSVPSSRSRVGVAPALLKINDLILDADPSGTGCVSCAWPAKARRHCDYPYR